MTTPHHGGTLAGRLKGIENEQKRISEKIRTIQAQLAKLQNVPGSQPWVSFGRVYRVEDLRSRFPDLRTALKHDLLLLQTKMKSLRLQAKRISFGKRRAHARQLDRDFKKHLYKTLKNAEKNGALDDATLGKLVGQSEQVLEGFVNLLDADPNDANIKMVLNGMELPLMLGSNVDTGICGRAFRSLGNAGKIIHDKAEKRFREHPDVKNFTRLLNKKAGGLLLGAELGDRPKNWRGAPRGTVHEVARGDSLSAISERYYGSPGYWDIIYFENIGVIGDNPEKLEIGTTLDIP